MSDIKEKLIALAKSDARTKGINITEQNINDVIAFLDMLDNCKNCKGLGECKNTTAGMTAKFEDSLTYVACSYRKQENLYHHVNHSFASNYLKEATLENFDISTNIRSKALDYAKKYVTNFQKEKGLYLYGTFGTGKTYFLSALANELSKYDVDSIIVFVPDLSRELKDSMNDNNLEGKINMLKNTDVLMLDDLGGEMMTTWFRDEVIAPVIQYRFLNNKPIFISSNMEYEALREHLSATSKNNDSLKANRILERIMQMTKRVCFDDVYAK